MRNRGAEEAVVAGGAVVEEAVGAAVEGVVSAAVVVDSVGEGEEAAGAASEAAAVAAEGAGAVVDLEEGAEEDLEEGADFERDAAIYDLLCKSIFIIHSKNVQYFSKTHSFALLSVLDRPHLTRRMLIFLFLLAFSDTVIVEIWL